jgi:hypothetical protein
MKHLRKLIPLLLTIAGTAPQLAHATGINVGRPYDYGYMKINDPRTRAKVLVRSACCTQQKEIINSSSLLSPSANANLNLAKGDYQFGQFESSFGGAFADSWTFSLAAPGQIKLSLTDSGLGFASSLLNIDNLKLELFDQDHKSLGSVADSLSLNVLLAANSRYSFLVSGTANGKLGGLYAGKLAVTAVAPVPIGDSLPFFAAALFVLGWQIRTRSQGYVRI